MPDSDQQEPERAEAALARAARLRRRRRDAALALPLLAAFLFLSPLIDAFAGGGRLLGVPLGLAYVFAAWIGLIVATARLARGLGDDDGGA
ncbi:hypothetical protein [Amaricoccus sp.]|uniref:hypothetical protein n=1 Tax=Amaricoccus sp. TaxID=1872485 RepID=UPI001B5B6EF2|nr:hypothetical protein [Amaricoccus sp.]MBP7001264.1 hypothetical protein [Amaricoccus sp.]